MSDKHRTMTVDQLFAHVKNVIEAYRDDDRFPERHEYVRTIERREEGCKHDNWELAVRQLVWALLEASTQVTTRKVKAEVLDNLMRAAFAGV